jgi:hypothetical protein
MKEVCANIVPNNVADDQWHLRKEVEMNFFRESRRMTNGWMELWSGVKVEVFSKAMRRSSSTSDLSLQAQEITFVKLESQDSVDLSV